MFRAQPVKSREDQELCNKANRLLIESGEMERLKTWVSQQLKQCGWTGELTENCKTMIKKRGVDNVTVDDIFNDLIGDANEHVPSEIQRELATKIKTFLLKNLAPNSD